MDLERVQAVIRPRTSWEAVDLGFGMARAWWKPVWVAWLATVAPAWWLAWCLSWLLGGEPWVALLVTWWLRPLFDRVPLYVVSRQLFGASPGVRDVLADLGRLWTRNFWAALTLQRLDLARSFDMPIWELEGLRGSERKARTALLQRLGRQPAVWLTVGCGVLEIFILLSCFELVTFLTPSAGWSEAAEMADLGSSSGELTTAFWWWTGVLSFLALTVIEPFYVAGGFSLYLSNRIHLEGWDIELAFRRLATRLTGGGPLRRKGGRAAGVVVCLLLGTGGAWASPSPLPTGLCRDAPGRTRHPAGCNTSGRLSPQPPMPPLSRAVHVQPPMPPLSRAVHVQPPTPSLLRIVHVADAGRLETPRPVAPGRASGASWGVSTKGTQVGPPQAIQEILAQPEFQTRQKKMVWRPRERKPDAPSPDQDSPSDDGSFIPSLSFLQPLVIAVAVALLAGLLFVIVKSLRLRRSPSAPDDSSPRAPLPAAVFGLDIRPESLPEDVPSAAWSAWERGEPAVALGLLYRAALASLVRREGLPVRVSWTEGDCVDFVRRKTGAERSDYFARLTRAWQSTAYAHRPPTADEARALCGTWGRHFGEAA